VPLTDILDNPLIPYEQDEVTRLILDTHDAQGFAALRHLTVGDFRDWLLDDATDTATLQRVARAITPEMAAAVSKLMRNQDLIRRQQMPGGDALSQHHRPARPPQRAPAAQPSHR
jgi:ethanolamine ammonia-lyase large subunit